MQPRRQTIPIFLLVKTAFQLLWQQRDDALRLGLVPTLLLFGGALFGKDAMITMLLQMQAGLAQPLPGGLAFTIIVMSLLVFASLALLMVNWLRFLLLGPMGAVGIGVSLRTAHLRFLVAAFLFSFVLMLAVTLLCLPLVLLGIPLPAANLIAFLAVLLIAVRFLPFLVGQAIDQPMSLAQAWNVSRGNGLAIAVSLMLVQLPFMLGFTVLEQVLDVIGFVALAPAGTLFILAVVQVATWICLASVLATVYRHLVGVRV